MRRRIKAKSFARHSDQVVRQMPTLAPEQVRRAPIPHWAADKEWAPLATLIGIADRYHHGGLFVLPVDRTAKTLQLPPEKVDQWLGQMIADGYLRRHPRRSPRRAHRYSLTADARKSNPEAKSKSKSDSSAGLRP